MCIASIAAVVRLARFFSALPGSVAQALLLHAAEGGTKRERIDRLCAWGKIAAWAFSVEKVPTKTVVQEFCTDLLSEINKRLRDLREQREQRAAGRPDPTPTIEQRRRAAASPLEGEMREAFTGLYRTPERWSFRLSIDTAPAVSRTIERGEQYSTRCTYRMEHFEDELRVRASWGKKVKGRGIAVLFDRVTLDAEEVTQVAGLSVFRLAQLFQGHGTQTELRPVWAVRTPSGWVQVSVAPGEDPEQKAAKAAEKWKKTQECAAFRAANPTWAAA